MKKSIIQGLLVVLIFSYLTLGKSVSADTGLYRLYHSGLQAHLYTTDTNEYKTLSRRGWQKEGLAWNTDDKKGEPVYRLYHPSLRVHLYTKDKNEYKVLATRGWQQEGSAYRSYGELPIYRLYHSGIRKHLYTKDTNEYKVLGERGWNQEGIAFYGLKPKNKPSTPPNSSTPPSTTTETPPSSSIPPSTMTPPTTTQPDTNPDDINVPNVESDFEWETVSEVGLDNEISGDGVVITQYKGTRKNINIPAQLGGKNVLGIRYEYDVTIDEDVIISIGIFENKGIEHVLLPDTIQYIGSSAFAYNKLTKVTIPQNVKAIGTLAFGFNNLASISIPNSVTDIDNFAFRGNQLTQVFIPDSVTKIGHQAFDSNQITSIQLPSHLKDQNNPTIREVFDSGVTITYRP